MASQPIPQTQIDTSPNQAASTANPRWPTMVDGKRKTKKRVRNFTPADRAAHRVFEKSRREAFNDQLMELARLIPAISSAARLSKHTIVNESIAYHRAQDKQCLAGIRGIQALLAERDELLEEVNSLRVLLQPGAITTTSAGRVARPLADEVVEFVRREAEINRINSEAMIRQSRQDSCSTTSPDQNNYSPDGDTTRNRAMEIHQQHHQQSHLDMLAGGPDLLGDVPEDFDFWEDIDPTQAIPSGLQTSAFDLDTAINNEPIPMPQRLGENSMFHGTSSAFPYPNHLGQEGLIAQMGPLELSAFPGTSGRPESTQNPNSNRTEMTQMMSLY
ncbi:uncharacterized protein TRUGW13939_05348 [Talaromyces rugulosus]|uniref:BHLH domain-containing protein n=1 Tax=Talaromyces rugulosus TaxID=121627 RepID=A0A7H8QW76_TALRU|nr:uncharacterized protein TRUGW13939_05348 [Talaromyces rugulosus]QKX58227.1 hypothetical protein TRUGW13939_05348 [Talaromyces rugulosus]